MTNKNKYVIESKMKYTTEEVWFPLSEDILAWEIDFHKLMLNDELRMLAYEKAIKEAIKPGMTVVDIGTGTGILSKWALEAGASKVYGIDVNSEILKKAHARIEAAGFINKYKTFNQLSYDVQLPEKVDVIISEILGNLADNEDMTPIIEDARSRFLKENGIILPKNIDTYLVPVNSIKVHEQIKNQNCKGVNPKYDLADLMQKLQINNPFDLYYDVVVPKNTYLSHPQKVQGFHFDGTDASEYKVEKIFKAEKDGMFTGFKGYFIAQLSPNVVLDISGDDILMRKTSDCWKHCYFPIENPFSIQKEDEIHLNYSRYYPKVRNSAFRQCYSWSGTIKRQGQVVYSFEQKTG